jgi:hypothetical protein
VKSGKNIFGTIENIPFASVTALANTFTTTRTLRRMKLFNKFRAKKTEHARAIDWIPAWSKGAQLPQVFANCRKVFVIYLVDDTKHYLFLFHD